MFIDEVKICVVGGRGGHGCISFRQQGRNRFKRRPTGGHGGRGGDVILQATPRLRTLLAFTKQIHWKAENGAHGGPNGRQGRRGRPCIVRVPVGTVVKDLRTQEVLADLTRPGQRLVVAHGGIGGRGNEAFLSNRFRSPRICETGEWGEERWLKLELKVLADVGLIGWPNAGKSTLLSRISRAKPKVGAYPFTTLEPQLGLVSRDFEEFVAVDIPGLIEGAHHGRGLGDRFLKHVERTRLLVHLVDLAGWEGRDPLEDYFAINRELEAFSPALAAKPQIVVGNKVDLLDEAEISRRQERFAQAGVELLPLSAVSGRGVTELIGRCFERLRALADPTEEEELPQAHAPAVERLYRFEDSAPWRLVQEEGGWRLEGPRVRRLGLLRLDSEDALRYLHEQLEQLGVLRALIESGARPGEVVRLGRATFEVSEEILAARVIFTPGR